jgi:hypothetical protein
MITKPLVFVSSTSRCDEERQALQKGLHGPYELYFFEEDRARGASPEARCKSMIEQSDAFVSLIGPDYGSEFPGAEPPRSIVEWELDEAVRQGHAEILPFVRKLEPGETYDPRQKQFVDRVRDFRTGAWCRFYSTAAELVDSVRQSLERWLGEVWSRLTEERQRLRRVAVPLFLALALIFGVLVAVVAGHAIWGELLGTQALLLFGSAFAGVAMCGMVTFWLYGGRHD